MDSLLVLHQLHGVSIMVLAALLSIDCIGETRFYKTDSVILDKDPQEFT